MGKQRCGNAAGALAVGLALTLLGCGQKTPAPATAPAAAAPATAAAGAWTPEALEELAAPIALYPDVILGHVLTASTNPQEVLDAGNWLLQNQNLKGRVLDEAAHKIGLSTSMRALLQFPETVDMMCSQIEWTTELGQAFTADQGVVLDAVQRLRAQAKEAGNLKSAGPLKVDTEKQGDQTVIVVVPSDPKVVYVPRYDPVAVYAPPPAVIPPPTTTAAAPVVQEGHSTAALITTGLLAFGAGMLVNQVFNNNDDYYHYGPNYGYGGMYYGGRPYYPPPPGMYRPPYGGGYYPAHGYTRPPNYQHGFNNNTIIVNNQGNNYWNRQRQNSPQTLPAQSPITAARPNRPEMDKLNRDAGKRPQQTKPDWKGQSSYAGARPENKAARDQMVQNSPRPDSPRPNARDTPQRPQGGFAGATQGGYAGTQDRQTPNRGNGAASPNRKPPAQARPNGMSDRGRDAMPDRASPPSRPAMADSGAGARARPAQPAAPPQTRDRDAFSGGGNAASERAASQRGHASMASSKSAARPGAGQRPAPAGGGGGKRVRP